MLQWVQDTDENTFVDFDLLPLQISILLGGGFFKGLYHPTEAPHHHHRHELFFVASGQCTFNTVSGQYSLPADAFVLIPAELDHSVCLNTPDTVLYGIKFQYTVSEQEAAEDAEDKEALLLERLARVSEDKQIYLFYHENAILEMLKSIRDEFLNKDSFYRQKLPADIMNLMICVLRKLSGPGAYAVPSATDPLPVKQEMLLTKGSRFEILDNRIDGFLNSHFSQHIRLEDLAASLHQSVSHTKRLLNQVYGLNFSELLARKRVQTAIVHMLRGSMQWSAIASLVGYDSYNGFLYAFNQVTGKTPSQYMKEARKHPSE